MDIEKVIDVSFGMILACITLAIIDNRRYILPARKGGEGGLKLQYQWTPSQYFARIAIPERPQAKFIEGDSNITFYKNSIECNCRYASMLKISVTVSITRSLKDEHDLPIHSCFQIYLCAITSWITIWLIFSNLLLYAFKWKDESKAS